MQLQPPTDQHHNYSVQYGQDLQKDNLHPPWQIWHSKPTCCHTNCPQQEMDQDVAEQATLRTCSHGVKLSHTISSGTPSTTRSPLKFPSSLFSLSPHAHNSVVELFTRNGLFPLSGASGRQSLSGLTSTESTASVHSSSRLPSASSLSSS